MNKTFAFKTLMLLSLVGSTSGIIPNAVQALNDEDSAGNRRVQRSGPANRDAEEEAARQAEIRAAQEKLAANQAQIRTAQEEYKAQLQELETALAKKGKK